MIAAYLAYQFAGLWALLWHFGAIGFAAILCFVGSYFSPVFKKELLWSGIVCVAVIVTLAVGVNLGENRVRAQCDAEKKLAVEGAQRARDKARRDLARKPSRWMPTQPRRDPYCRDC